MVLATEASGRERQVLRRSPLTSPLDDTFMMTGSHHEPESQSFYSEGGKGILIGWAVCRGLGSEGQGTWGDGQQTAYGIRSTVIR